MITLRLQLSWSYEVGQSLSQNVERRNFGCHVRIVMPQSAHGSSRVISILRPALYRPLGPYASVPCLCIVLCSTTLLSLAIVLLLSRKIKSTTRYSYRPLHSRAAESNVFEGAYVLQQPSPHPSLGQPPSSPPISLPLANTVNCYATKGQGISAHDYIFSAPYVSLPLESHLYAVIVDFFCSLLRLRTSNSVQQDEDE